jgi:2-isopropylmalate synthase
VNACTRIDLHPRHPYCGDLIFTAFSGGHQDAIRKCLDIQGEDALWDVPYLSINPQDVGRTYQDVIRINSQSGKGGVTYVLETRLGVSPPRWLQIDFSRVVQSYCDDCGTEVSAEEIWQLFHEHCLRPSTALKLHRILPHNEPASGFSAIISRVHMGEEVRLHGDVGRADAFVEELADALFVQCDVLDCGLQALNYPNSVGMPRPSAVRSIVGEVPAIAYVRLKRGGECFGGVAIGTSRAEALVQAALNALGRIVGTDEDESAGDFLPRVERMRTA